MTNEEIIAQILRARDELNNVNFDVADLLANEVIEELNNPNNALKAGDGMVELHHANALLCLASTAFGRGRFETSLEYGQQMLALAQEFTLHDVLPKAYTHLGNVYWNLGIYEKALDYFSQGVIGYEKLGEQSGVAGVIGNMGLVYTHLGIHDKALEYLSKGLATYEELGEKLGIARFTGNIGIIYKNLGDLNKALEYLSKALAIHEELGGQSGIASVTGNIGLVYINLGMYDKALEYFYKAFAINEKIGRQSAVAKVTGNIGIAYYFLGSHDKALEYYFQALAIHEAQGDIAGASLVMGNIGVVYAIQEFSGYNVRLAEEYFLKAIAINHEIGAKQQLYSVQKSLSDLYKTEKRWEECQLYFEQYHDNEKEVQSEEAANQVRLMEHRRKIEESERDRQVKLARFQEQEKILHNILPSQIADRMIDGEKTIADSHEHVSVFFSDIVGFTKLSQRVTAQELVGMLNGIFSQFDQLARKHGLEKIKTIGDAYMAVCGAPIQVENHAERAAFFALDVAELMKNYHTDMGEKIDVRIGLHTGAAVAGIIGENKFSYDLWGDAVNTASRMESHGEPGKIHCTDEFVSALSLASLVSLSSFQFIERGEMAIKGKGLMRTYFLEKQ